MMDGSVVGRPTAIFASLWIVEIMEHVSARMELTCNRAPAMNTMATAARHTLVVRLLMTTNDKIRGVVVSLKIGEARKTRRRLFINFVNHVPIQESVGG
eukprot:SAG11_NODE_773_length_7236_cov_4.526412_2_plen_99_part_00